jgi:ribonuclease H / adenosylcobalamin/alpha-ribazole phosphatase
VSSSDDTHRKSRRRRPRRAGRANSDAERRALAKANARAPRWAAAPVRPGFAALTADGGSRGSPPTAAIGYVLHGAEGSIVASHAEVIGVLSAIVAEYRALLAGLGRAYELGFERVDARSDSRLLVSHLSGDRRPTNPKLVALGNEILELTTKIGSVTISWIPSDANGEAHALVTDALARRARSG